MNKAFSYIKVLLLLNVNNINANNDLSPQNNERKINFSSKIYFTSGVHTNFGNSKAVTNQVLFDVGINYKNTFNVCIGSGFHNYKNLSPLSNTVFDGESNLIPINQYPNTTILNTANIETAEMYYNPSLYHIPVHISLSKKITELKKTFLTINLRGGYLFSSKELYNIPSKSNYKDVEGNFYQKDISINYLNRPFLSSNINFLFPSFNNKSKFNFGVGYLIDFMKINYHIYELKLEPTHLINPAPQFRKVPFREFEEVVKKKIQFITVNVGFNF